MWYESRAIGISRELFANDRSLAMKSLLCTVDILCMYSRRDFLNMREVSWTMRPLKILKSPNVSVLRVG